MSKRPIHEYVLFRLVLSLVAGVAAAVLVSSLWRAEAAPVSGWIVMAATFCLWTWLTIHHLDSASTREHAIAEDPGRAGADIVLLVAALASLVGVAVLLAAGNQKGFSASIQAGLGLLTVAASWFMVHVVYITRYARLYYREDGDVGGVDFNQEDSPNYQDFAYLAFTIGMTYQVSDTDISDRSIRHAALSHMLLSYLLGALVLAASVNLLSSFASSGH